LEAYFKKDSEIALLENILRNTKRYQKMFLEVIDKLMPDKNNALPLRDDEIETIDQLFMGQRMMNVMNNPEMKAIVPNKSLNIPPELKRN
jgi:hydroxymethylpyrimidine/phosphomethylpyrimidine kinase